jgi:hypothetical protein
MTIVLPIDATAPTVTVKEPGVVVLKAPPVTVVVGIMTGPAGLTLHTAQDVMSFMEPSMKVPCAVSACVSGIGVAEYVRVIDAVAGETVMLVSPSEHEEFGIDASMSMITPESRAPLSGPT